MPETPETNGQPTSDPTTQDAPPAAPNGGQDAAPDSNGAAAGPVSPPTALAGEEVRLSSPAPDHDPEAAKSLAQIYAAAKRVKAHRHSLDAAIIATKHAKAVEKERQEAWEDAVRDEQLVIADCEARKATSAGPLFAKAEAPKEAAPAAAEEAWRSHPLAEVDGIKPAALKALEKAKLRTVGDVARFTEGRGSLTELKGLGPETAGQVADALAAFHAGWAKDHPEPIVPDGAQGPAPTEAEWRAIPLHDALGNGFPDLSESVGATLGDAADRLVEGNTLEVLTSLGSEDVERLAARLFEARTEVPGFGEAVTGEMLGYDVDPPAPKAGKPAKRAKKAADALEPAPAA